MNDDEYREALAVLDAANVIADAMEATKGTPLQWLFKRFRDEAAASLTALVEADADDPKVIRALQYDVKRFYDTARFLKEAIAMGVDANHKLAEHERMSPRERAQAAGMILPNIEGYEIGDDFE